MITGRLLCWAGIVPHINRIATEIRTALMLRLLRRYFGIAALLRPLFIFPQAARGSGGRWLENKTLTRIQMPKQGLAVTSVADPGTCGDRAGAGGRPFSPPRARYQPPPFPPPPLFLPPFNHPPPLLSPP